MANGSFAYKKPDSCAFVIFGVTGDLTHRLVLPSLYNLAASNLLPERFCIVGITRKEASSEKLRDEPAGGLAQICDTPHRRRGSEAPPPMRDSDRS